MDNWIGRGVNKGMGGQLDGEMSGGIGGEKYVDGWLEK